MKYKVVPILKPLTDLDGLLNGLTIITDKRYQLQNDILKQLPEYQHLLNFLSNYVQLQQYNLNITAGALQAYSRQLLKLSKLNKEVDQEE
jgi:hypothetical protein